MTPTADQVLFPKVTQVDVGLDDGAFCVMSRDAEHCADGPFSTANEAVRAWRMTCATRRPRFYVAQQAGLFDSEPFAQIRGQMGTES